MIYPLFVICLLMILMILFKADFTYTAKAGAVQDWKVRITSGAVGSKYLKVDGTIVDVSKLYRFFSLGFSMSEFGIDSDKTVFAERLTKDEVKKINDFPVLVLKIGKHERKNIFSFFDSKYKLRKYVGRVNIMDNPQNCYGQFKEKIAKYITEDVFINDFNGRKESIKKYDPEFKNDYILSITYRVDVGEFHISIHDTNLVFGVVKYVA